MTRSMNDTQKQHGRWQHPQVRMLLRKSVKSALCSYLVMQVGTAVAMPIFKPTVSLLKPISFRLNFTPQNSSLNIRLFAANDSLVLRMPNGKRVVFSPEHSKTGQRLFAKQTHTHKILGNIQTQSARRVWNFQRGASVEFLGSYPIAIVLENQKRITFQYRDGELTSLHTNPLSERQPNQEISELFTHAQALLEQAQTLACPEGSDTASVNSAETLANLENEQLQQDNEECTNADAPLPLGFEQPTDDGVIRIDIRPADCQSYFTAFASVPRGNAIEQAMANHAPYLGSASGGQSFPVADFWNNGSVYVLISRDLTADSYNTLENPNGLYDQLMIDGENIHDNLIQPLSNEGQITHTELGETAVLTSADAQVIYLDIVVQYGVTTPEQQAIFNQAATELLERYGIVLRIIEIP